MVRSNSSTDNAIAKLTADMRRAVNLSPEDERRERAAFEAEQKRRKEIAEAFPRRVHEQLDKLKAAASDEFTDQWLEERREKDGLAKGSESKLPAQRDKARVKVRYDFAKETLGKELGQPEVEEILKSGYRTGDRSWMLGKSPEADWRKHVEGLGLDRRERIRYEAEANETQPSVADLNDREAMAMRTSSVGATACMGRGSVNLSRQPDKMAYGLFRSCIRVLDRSRGLNPIPGRICSARAAIPPRPISARCPRTFASLVPAFGVFRIRERVSSIRPSSPRSTRRHRRTGLRW